jgi:ankyrin repeat protein
MILKYADDERFKHHFFSMSVSKLEKAASKSGPEACIAFNAALASCLLDTQQKLLNKNTLTSALEIASSHGIVEYIEPLLQAGADPAPAIRVIQGMLNREGKHSISGNEREQLITILSILKKRIMP